MRKALALALFAAACGKPAPEAAKPGRLAEALGALRVTAPCDKVVSLDWAHGWPVPVSGGVERYAVFFYPLGGNPASGPVLGSPRARAVFDVRAGKVVDCSPLPPTADPAPGGRWPAPVEGLGMKEFDARAAGLYAAAAEAAAAYASGDAAGAAGYWKAFDSLAEPALRAHYYALSPAFWEWLREAGVGTLPPPKS